MATTAKTFKYKMYASARNRKIHRQINAAGMVYNHCIALHKRYYSLYHKSLNKFALQKHLTKLKRVKRFSYLKEIGSQAVQDVTDRIARAYKLFFEYTGKRKIRPPQFKKVRKYKSFTLKQAGWALDEDTHTIVINGQKYRYFKSRSIEGKIKTVTVKRDHLGDIYVYFVCQVEAKEVKPRLGKSIGFDFGFEGQMLVATDAAEDIAEPKFIRARLRDLRNLCRARSRCRLHSNHWYALNRACNRLYRKTQNQRRDYQYKLAHQLCREYAVICLEDLNMKWQASAGHGKKVGDYGFASFVIILQYIATQYGTTVVKVGKFFPSTQLCHNCGLKDPFVKDLKIREWEYPFCQTHHNRDRNAAKNILSEGLRLLAEA